MPKKTSTMKAWVCRDGIDCNNVSDYCIYVGKKPSKERDLEYCKGLNAHIWYGHDTAVCKHEFEKHFFKLKPGQGPIEVDIMIKRRKR